MNYSSTETCSFAGEFMDVGIKKIKKPQDNFQFFVKKKKSPFSTAVELEAAVA